MKTILMLGAGPEQCSAIIVAKELGYKVIALDSNLLAPGKKFADKFIQTDIKNVENILNIAKLGVDGIFVHAIELSHVVAEVCEKLSLPSVNRESAINSTNKLKRLEILKKNNIPCAKFGFAENFLKAKKIAVEIGYPVIIKPNDNAGSRGVILIENEFSLQKYFDYSLQLCKDQKYVVIEEYMIGPQVSTETVIYHGKMFTTGFSDRNYQNTENFLPYFIEDGGDMPSNLSSNLQKSVKDTVQKAITALGINFGAAKGDVLIKNGIPHIIEMASRTSGGRFASDQVPASTGVNILKPLIKMAVSDDVDENEFNPKFNKGCSQRYIIPKPGKVVSINGLENAKKIEGVFSVILSNDLKIGAIIPDITDNSIRKGIVMAVGDTRDDAIKRVTMARDLIKIKTVPI